MRHPSKYHMCSMLQYFVHWNETYVQKNILVNANFPATITDLESNISLFKFSVNKGPKNYFQLFQNLVWKDLAKAEAITSDLLLLFQRARLFYNESGGGGGILKFKAIKSDKLLLRLNFETKTNLSGGKRAKNWGHFLRQCLDQLRLSTASDYFSTIKQCLP